MTDDAETPSMSAARRIAHIAPLTTLSEKIKTSHTALIVIDMQNDFCASDGFVAKGVAVMFRMFSKWPNGCPS